MDARHSLLLQLRDRYGEKHRKRRALAFALTRGPNRAAVLFHQLLADCEPQSEAAVRPRGRAVLLRESLEDVCEIARGNADAGVADTQLEMRIHPLQQDLYLAAFGRKF